jgi:hypothetical protein
MGWSNNSSVHRLIQHLLVFQTPQKDSHMSNNTSKEVTPKDGEVNINYDEGTITQGGIFE